MIHAISSRVNVITLVILVLAGAVWLGFSRGQAQTSDDDYLARPTRYETGLVGLGRGEIARVGIANHAMPQGMTVVFEFLDQQGEVVAKSESLPVGLNQSATFDFMNPDQRLVRAELRARVEVQGLTDPRYTPGFIPSLKVITRATARTLVRVDLFKPSPWPGR